MFCYRCCAIKIRINPSVGVQQATQRVDVQRVPRCSSDMSTVSGYRIHGVPLPESGSRTPGENLLQRSEIATQLALLKLQTGQLDDDV